MKNFKITTKELPDSEMEIYVEVAWAEFEKYRAQGLKSLQKRIELPGFRKGNVPENMIVSKVGEANILEESAEILIQETYSDIIEKEKIAAIGRPGISITKIAPENPLTFTIRVAVMPKAELGDYKKIAKEVNAESNKENAEEITEKEVDEAFERVKKGHEEHMKQHADAGHTEEDHAGHDHSLPTKEDVKKHLAEDKKNRAIEKQRLSTIEKIIGASKIPVPKILVEAELEKMLGQFESDIARMGIQSKDYFAHIKKTPEELKADWAVDAEKRVKTDIILAEIAKTEKISPDKKKVDYEIAQIISMHPEADPLRARVYVEHMLTNQAVFSFLEER